MSAIFTFKAFKKAWFVSVCVLLTISLAFGLWPQQAYALVREQIDNARALENFDANTEEATESGINENDSSNNLTQDVGKYVQNSNLNNENLASEESNNEESDNTKSDTQNANKAQNEDTEDNIESEDNSINEDDINAEQITSNTNALSSSLGNDEEATTETLDFPTFTSSSYDARLHSTDSFLAGEGTKENPWKADTADKLIDCILHHRSDYIALTNDVCIDDLSYESGGFEGLEFNGHLDGKNAATGGNFLIQIGSSSDLESKSPDSTHGLINLLTASNTTDPTSITNIDIACYINNVDDISFSTWNLGALACSVRAGTKLIIDNVNIVSPVEYFSELGSSSPSVIQKNGSGWWNNALTEINMGGLIGYVDDGANLEVKNCDVNVEINSDYAVEKHCAGFVGKTEDSSQLAFSNCTTGSDTSINAGESLWTSLNYCFQVVKIVGLIVLGTFGDITKSVLEKKALTAIQENVKELNAGIKEKNISNINHQIAMYDYSDYLMQSYNRSKSPDTIKKFSDNFLKTEGKRFLIDNLKKTTMSGRDAAKYLSIDYKLADEIRVVNKWDANNTIVSSSFYNYLKDHNALFDAFQDWKKESYIDQYFDFYKNLLTINGNEFAQLIDGIDETAKIGQNYILLLEGNRDDFFSDFADFALSEDSNLFKININDEGKLEITLKNPISENTTLVTNQITLETQKKSIAKKMFQKYLQDRNEGKQDTFKWLNVIGGETSNKRGTIYKCVDVGAPEWAPCSGKNAESVIENMVSDAIDRLIDNKVYKSANMLSSRSPYDKICDTEIAFNSLVDKGNELTNPIKTTYDDVKNNIDNTKKFVGCNSVESDIKKIGGYVNKSLSKYYNVQDFIDNCGSDLSMLKNLDKNNVKNVLSEIDHFLYDNREWNTSIFPKNFKYKDNPYVKALGSMNKDEFKSFCEYKDVIIEYYKEQKHEEVVYLSFWLSDPDCPYGRKMFSNVPCFKYFDKNWDMKNPHCGEAATIDLEELSDYADTIMGYEYYNALYAHLGAYSYLNAGIKYDNISNVSYTAMDKLLNVRENVAADFLKEYMNSFEIKQQGITILAECLVGQRKISNTGSWAYNHTADYNSLFFDRLFNIYDKKINEYLAWASDNGEKIGKSCAQSFMFNDLEPNLNEHYISDDLAEAIMMQLYETYGKGDDDKIFQLFKTKYKNARNFVIKNSDDKLFTYDLAKIINKDLAEGEGALQEHYQMEVLARETWAQQCLEEYRRIVNEANMIEVHPYQPIPKEGDIAEIPLTTWEKTASPLAAGLFAGANAIGEVARYTLKDDSLANIHQNTYSAGFIGSCYSKNISFDSCTNSAFSQGGKAAAGFVAYSNNTNFEFNKTTDLGSSNATFGVSKWQHSDFPTAGSFIGMCSYDSGNTIKMSYCMSQGRVASRCYSGGYIGWLDGGDSIDVSFDNCGVYAVIYGVMATGGFIGNKESGAKCSFGNCYSYGLFDNVSMKREIIRSGFWFLLSDIVTPATEQGLYSNDYPGAYVGDLDSAADLYFENSYYYEGDMALGCDNDKKISDYDKENYVMPITWWEIYGGALTYKLNSKCGEGEAPFGQCLDNVELNNYNRQDYPFPGSKYYVYKDEASAKTIYTNYNPRTIDAKALSFHVDEHSSIKPDLVNTKVKAGDYYVFSAKADSGYEIKEVKAVSAGHTKVLDVCSNSEYGDCYCLDNIDEEYEIYVSTSEKKPEKPTEGYGTENFPYIINNAEQLLWFDEQTTTNLDNDICIKLADDIDMTGLNWTPICNYQFFPYKGTIDGNGHTIYGLSSKDQNVNAFISGMDGATVKNLTLDGNFKDAIFAYSAQNCTIENCIAYGSVNCSKNAASAFAAYACQNVTIKDCENHASVTSNSQDCAVGAFVGMLTTPSYYYDFEGEPASYNKLNANVCNCKNYGNLSAYSGDIGGIVGKLISVSRSSVKSISDLDNINVLIDKCENNGLLYCTTSHEADDAGVVAGGIVAYIGESSGSFVINGCVNNSTIGYDNCNKQNTGTATSAGILSYNGLTDNLTIKLTNCGNNALVYGYAQAAGIWADDTYNSRYKADGSHWDNYIENCYNLAQSVSSNMENALAITLARGEFYISNTYYYSHNNQKDIYYKYDSEKTSVVNEQQVSSGELCFKLNKHNTSDIPDFYSDAYKDWNFDKYYENDAFVQKLDDNDSQSQSGTIKSVPSIATEENENIKVIYNNGFAFGSQKYLNSNGQSYFEKNAEPHRIYFEVIGGKGDISGYNYSLDDGELNFTITPDNGYFVDEVHDVYKDKDGNEVDNKISLDLNSSFILSEIKCDHTIRVTFSDSKPIDVVDGVCHIKDWTEFKTFTHMVNSGQNFLNAVLDNNIYLDYNECYESIGLNSAYKGTFDGNNKCIFTKCTKPLFSSTASNAVIKNLYVEVEECFDLDSAVLVKNSSGVTIDSVTISGSAYETSKNFGVFVCDATTGSTKIQNSHNRCLVNNVDFMEEKDNAILAGFIAVVHACGSVDIKNCENVVSLMSYPKKSTIAAGAIASCDGNIGAINIDNFTNSGTIFASKSAAGILANYKSIDSTNSVKLINCINKGCIKANLWAAGILAYIEDTEEDTSFAVLNCENTGNILCTKDNGESSEGAGGIIASVNDGDVAVVIDSCLVNCDTITSAGDTGAIVGFVDNSDYFHVYNSIISVSNIETTCNSVSEFLGWYHKGLVAGDIDTACGAVVKNTYSVNGVDLCFKLIGEGDAETNDLNLIHGGDIIKGKFSVDYFAAISDKNNHQDQIAIDNLSKFKMGQNINLANSPVDDFCHINSARVYRCNDSFGEYYTNYNNERRDGASEDSFLVNTCSVSTTGSGSASRSFFAKVPKDASDVTYSVSFSAASDSKLVSVKLVGKEADYFGDDIVLDYDVYNDVKNNVLKLSYNDMIDKLAEVRSSQSWWHEDKETAVQSIKKWILDYGVNIEYEFSTTEHCRFGQGTAENPYLIENPQQLLWFSKEVNKDKADDPAYKLCAKIAEDTEQISFDTIDMSNIKDWQPIGLHNYKGTFDGSNKKIVGLKSSLFKEAYTATVKDLTLDVSNTSGNGAGLILNCNSCYISNVHVKGVISTPNQSYYGGLVGSVGGSVSTYNNSKDYEAKAKGRGTRIYDCTSNVSFNITSFNEDVRVGGFVGQLLPNSTMVIKGSKNKSQAHSTNSITGVGDSDSWAAGFVAYCACENTNLTLYDNTNAASISGNYAGGFVGAISDFVYTELGSGCECWISKCINESDSWIKGDNAGGYIGELTDCEEENGHVTIEHSLNKGRVDSTNGHTAAGFIARTDEYFIVNISYSVNAGYIHGGNASCDDGAGGFIGEANWIDDDSVVDHCINYGVVVCDDNSYGGAIIGDNDSGSDDIKLSYCEYLNTSASSYAGSGSKDIVEDHVFAKSKKQFDSGEVCYELTPKLPHTIDIDDSAISFGQNKEADGPDDEYPVPNSEYKMYKNGEGFYSNLKNADYIINVKNKDEDKGVVYFQNPDGSIGDKLSGLLGYQKGTIFNAIVKPNDGLVITKIEIDGYAAEIKDDDINKISFNDNKNHTIEVSFGQYRGKPSEGEGTPISPYVIKDYKELLWFKDNVNDPKVENGNLLCAKLGNNINAEDYGYSHWEPIGTATRPYCGTFDGNGNTIYNLSIDQKSKEHQAFMGYTLQANVKDLNFSNINIVCSSMAAGVIYEMNGGRISNVKVEGNIRSAGSLMAGVVAYVTSKKGFTDISISGCTSSVYMSDAHYGAGATVGGIVGMIDSPYSAVTVDYCTNTSEVHSNTTDWGHIKSSDDDDNDYAGGIIGNITCSTASAKIHYNTNNAKIIGRIAGGIVGTIGDHDSKINATDINTIEISSNTVSPDSVICGDDCGGVVGLSNIKNSNSKVYIEKNTNVAAVGMLGLCLHNVGGIVGHATIDETVLKFRDTENLTYELDANKEMGTIQNDAHPQIVASNVAFWFSNILQVGGDALGYAMVAYGTCFWNVLGWITAIVSTAIGVWQFIKDIEEGTAFIDQYSGGMIGYDEMESFTKVDNSIMFGYVHGGDDEGSIVGHKKDKIASYHPYNFNNNYSLAKKYKVVDFGTEASFDDFVSGRVGYELQQATLDKQFTSNVNDSETYGQVIDDLSLGDPETLPSLERGNVKIYKATNKLNQTYYTNYDPEKYSRDTVYSVTSDFTKKIDENNLTNADAGNSDHTHSEIAMDVEEIKSLYNVAILNGRSYGEIEPCYNDYNNTVSFDISTLDNFILEFKPNLQNNTSICDVKLEGVNENVKVERKLNDDGSVTKYFNPIYDDTASSIISFDYKVDYHTDGSVRLTHPGMVKSNKSIHVYLKDNPSTVFDYNVNHDKTLFFPWNSSQELPNDNNNYYLTKNVVLNSDYVSNYDLSNINLNGHYIILKNNAKIIVEKNSVLNISDSSPTAWNYSKEDNRYVFADWQKTVFFPEDIAEREHEKPTDSLAFGELNAFQGGFIYGDTNSNESLFVNNQGSLALVGGSYFQNYNSGLVKSDMAEKAQLSVDAKIHRLGQDDDNTEVASFKLDSNYEYGDFKIGKSFVAVNDTENEDNDASDICDILFSSQTGYVEFDEEYVWETPLNVKATKDVPCVYLTKGFDSKINEDTDISKVFNCLNQDKKIAFCGNVGFGVPVMANELCIVNNEDSITVPVSFEGEGNVYPKGDINYKCGSDIKLHFTAETLNMLNNVDVNVTKVLTSSIPTFGFKSSSYVAEDEGRILLEEGTYHYFNIQKENVDEKTFYNTEIKFFFKSLKDIMSDVDKWESWTDPNSLPDVASDTPVPIGYRLETDVELSDTWTVPAGAITLDLNGHTISIKADAKNTILLDNSKSVLLIMDSSIYRGNNENEHFFKSGEDGTYSQASSSDLNTVKTYGGLITGANLHSTEYYKYKQKSGAVVANAGTLLMTGGNIAGNAASGLDGGAAISVNKDATVDLYEDVRICANSCSGDKDYESKYFAAGIANKGNLEFRGRIDNNNGVSFAASAISNTYGASFTNRGAIMNNHLLFDADKDSQSKSIGALSGPFGAVYNEGEFLNCGTISKNVSDFENAGVVNLGQMKINEANYIVDNVSKLKSSVKEKHEHLDILDVADFNIELMDNLSTSEPSIIFTSRSGITQNWINCNKHSYEVFKPATFEDENKDLKPNSNDDSQEVDPEYLLENYTVAIGADSELHYEEKSQIIDLNVNIHGNGKVKLNQDYYSPYVAVPAECIPAEDSEFAAILVNGEQTSFYAKDDNMYNIITDFVLDKETGDKKCNVDVYFVSKTEKSKHPDYVYYYSDKFLPSFSGKFLLQNDINLDHEMTYGGDLDDVIIDLNGHNVIQNSIDTNVINVSCKMKIEDSNPNRVNHLKKTSDEGNYVIDETGDIVVRGGIIGGILHYEDTLDYHRSAIAVNDTGLLVMNGGNICGNSVFYGDGAAALYVGEKANAILSDKVNISYNFAYGDDTSEEAKEAVAGMLLLGKAETRAQIHDNYAKINSVAGIFAKGSSSSLDNSGNIYKNTVTNASCAGIKAVDSYSLNNSGDIYDNFVNDNSYGAAYLKNVEFNNQGNIYNNNADDVFSAPGIFVDENTSINLEAKSKNLGSTTEIYNNCLTTYGWTEDIRIKDGRSIEKPIITIMHNYNNVHPTSISIDQTDANSCVPLIKNNRDYSAHEANAKFYDGVLKAGVFALGEDNIINYASKSRVVTVDTASNNGGKVLPQGIAYLKKNSDVKADIKVCADAGYHIGSIFVNDQNIGVESVKEYTYTADSSMDRTIVAEFVADTAAIRKSSLPTPEKEKLEDEEAQKLLNNINWNLCSAFPNESGDYRLTTNVVVDDTWLINKDKNIRLDLNGHSISPSKDFADKNSSFISLEDKASLTILDTTSKENKYKLDDNGFYKADKDGQITLIGGLITGFSLNDKCLINISKESSFNLSGVNIINNKVSDNACLINNDGKLYIDKKSSVCANQLKNNCAIVNNTEALLRVLGKISDNQSFYKSGAIYNAGTIEMGANAHIDSNIVNKENSKNKKIIDIVYNINEENKAEKIKAVSNFNQATKTKIAFEFDTKIDNVFQLSDCWKDLLDKMNLNMFELCETDTHELKVINDEIYLIKK